MELQGSAPLAASAVSAANLQPAFSASSNRLSRQTVPSAGLHNSSAAGGREKRQTPADGAKSGCPPNRFFGHIHIRNIVMRQ
jgi:hypothetical protein